jgi:hypothetical protein
MISMMFSSKHVRNAWEGGVCLHIPGKLLLGAGFAIYTPSPTAPIAAMVTISNQVALIH